MTKYAAKKTDRHGKTRWYYHRDGRYWPLPGSPDEHQLAYDDLHSRFGSGELRRAANRRSRKNNPEAAFTRQAERAIIWARQRAVQWKRPFDLDSEWVRDKIAIQDCRCALTGIPFSVTTTPGERNPYAPSVLKSHRRNAMNERGPVMDTSRMAAAQQRRRQRERIGVDPRCVELAAHFLSGALNSKPEDVTELAEIIQCRVESFIADIGLPLTDVQRSIRDGTFGVKSA